jgi:hypothetical protein
VKQGICANKTSYKTFYVQQSLQNIFYGKVFVFLITQYKYINMFMYIYTITTLTNTYVIFSTTNVLHDSRNSLGRVSSGSDAFQTAAHPSTFYSNDMQISLCCIHMSAHNPGRFRYTLFRSDFHIP